MLNIAICDNNSFDLHTIKSILQNWLNLTNKHCFNFHEYINSCQLINDIENKIPIDIFILDILMPEIDGINLGNQIRKSSPNALIIFVTSSPEFALDAFNLHALRYISKPIDDSELISAIEFAISIIKKKPRTPYIIRNSNQITNVYIEDIMYIENDIRNMTYTLENNSTVIGIRRNITFESAHADLTSLPNFIQPHKSFILNMNYINTIRGDTIIMDGGKEIPISRQRLNDIRARYLHFIQQEVNN